MKKVKILLLYLLITIIFAIIRYTVIIPNLNNEEKIKNENIQQKEEKEFKAISDETKEKLLKNLKDKKDIEPTVHTSSIKMSEADFKKLKNNILIQNNKPNFNEYDITEKSYLNLERIKVMLKGTKLECLAQAFLLAEEEYNINAIALMSIVSLESGYGESERANNGSNNLTGYAVYSNKSRGTYFNSWDDCVMATAKLLRNNYVNPDGMFNKNIGYNGKSLKEINLSYSETSYWNEHVTIIAKDYLKKI